MAMQARHVKTICAIYQVLHVCQELWLFHCYWCEAEEPIVLHNLAEACGQALKAPRKLRLLALQLVPQEVDVCQLLIVHDLLVGHLL